MINVPDIIGAVVDAMRKTGTYSSFSKVGNLYSLVSANTLVEGEWITLNGTDEFQAISVSSSGFDILSLSDPLASGTWKSLEPFYLYGVIRELSNILLMKDKDKVFKFQKYPLIALRLPVPQDVAQDSVHDVSLNVAILAFTEKNFRAPQRYEEVITPILIPLYLDFLLKIEESSDIMTIGTPVHQKVDRLFYGVEALQGNEAYIFNDPLDGIELIDLDLKLINDNC